MNKKKSIGHVAVGRVIKTIFKNNKVIEEFPYKKALKDFYKKNKYVRADYSLLSKASRLHADWAIIDLKIFVEVQGDQHYVPVRFSGDMISADLSFSDQLLRDRAKRAIALEANWLLIEIPFTKVIKPGYGEIEKMIYGVILGDY